MPTSLDRVAQQLEALRARVDRGLRTPQLGNSAIDNGSFPVKDSEGQTTVIVGQQSDGTAGAITVAGPYPPIPAAPDITQAALGINVRWGGMFVDPQPNWASPVVAPMTFAGVVVEVSTSSAFTVLVARGTIPSASGGDCSFLWPGGQTLYARLRTRDANGKLSTPSATVSMITGRVVDSDLAPGSVTFAQLADNAVTEAKIASGAVSAAKTAVAAIDPATGNLKANTVAAIQIQSGSIAAEKIAAGAITTEKLTVASFHESIIANGGFSDIDAAGVPLLWTTVPVGRVTSTTDAYAGAYAATVQANASEVVDLYSEPFPVEPGQTYGCSLLVKSPTSQSAGAGVVFSNTPGAIRDDVGTTYVEAYDMTPTPSYSKMDDAQIVAPASLRYGRMVLRVHGQAFARTVIWDEVVLRQAAGTSFIENLAVSNAKIANLAVDDAKIGSLAVGKLTAGVMTASITNSGVLRSAVSGKRYEIDNAGIRLINGSGITVFNASTVSGNIEIVGTYKTDMGGNRIEVGAPGDPYGNIYFYDSQATGKRAYINAVAIAGGFLGLGMNSAQDSFGNGTTLFLLHDHIRLQYNTQTGTPGLRRGGYFYADKDISEFGITLTTSETIRAAVKCDRVSGEISTTSLLPLRCGKGFISGDAAEMVALGGAKIYMDYAAPNLHFRNANNVGAIVKTFIIDHPTDAAKYLIHATTESPQNGVEYWGIAHLEDGKAEVQLPAYFESLCAVDNRVVMLNPVLPDLQRKSPDRKKPKVGKPQTYLAGDGTTHVLSNAPETGVPTLAASYPRDGMFTIQAEGSYPETLEVYWLVKAVRKDVPALLVEPLKTEITVRGEGPYRYYDQAVA